MAHAGSRVARIGYEWRHRLGVNEDCSMFVVRYRAEGYGNEIIGRCHYDTSVAEEGGEQLIARLLKAADEEVQWYMEHPDGKRCGEMIFL